MNDDDLAPLIRDYFASGAAKEDMMQEHSLSQGECPNCGHDWTAHGDFIARGEKVCWTYDMTTCTWQCWPRPFVVMEDTFTHIEENGYECDDPDCICHWANCNRYENEHNLEVGIQRAEYEAQEDVEHHRHGYGADR